MSRSRLALLLLAVLAVAGIVSAGSEPPLADAPPRACAGAGDPDASLFLVGDAGAPRTDEPLLAALTRSATERVAALGAERTAIAFLGDDVYPAGLPAADDAYRPEAERRLDAQLDAIRASGARGLVLPGNHDWDDAGADGWNAVLRAERLVAERGAPGTRWLPPGGCPGPFEVRLGDTLRLLLLDTQWWLHEGARPEGAGSACAARSEAEVVSALGGALRAAETRHAVVMMHHPLVTGGPHGARFRWQEHLFPLRELHRALWIPLPVLGSAYPIARALGVSGQDVVAPRNLAMREALAGAMTGSPPVLAAAGHDHGLQLLRGGAPELPARFELVSGAGSPRQITWVRRVEGTLFARAAPGFARLDARRDGALEIEIVELGEGGASRSAFRACLAEPGVLPPGPAGRDHVYGRRRSEARPSPSTAMPPPAARASPVRNERGQ